MKKILLFLMVLGSVACSKQNSVQIEGKINLSANILPLTRINVDESGKGSFTSGDIISLTVSGLEMTSQILKFEIGNTALYWKDLNLPSGIQDVNFAGCYPVLERTSGSIGTFDVSSAADKDLLLAPAVSVKSGSSNSVDLAFSHALHRLRIIYSSSGDYTQEELQLISTKCSAKSTCEVDLVKGVLSRTLSQTATFTAKSSDAVFLLPPQESAGVTLSMELFGQKKEFKLSDWMQQYDHMQEMLEGGKELRLTINVSKSGISFGDMTIGAWGDQGSVEGDIIL